MKKITIIFLLIALSIFFSIASGCAKKVHINSATLLDLDLQESKKMSDIEISKLNDILENGISPVIEPKLVLLNYLKVKDLRTGTMITLGIFNDGYIRFSGNRPFYRIKKKYRKVFNEIVFE